MEKLEIAILCCVWNTVLQRVQKTSTQLQMVALDLSNAVALVGSLRDFIADLRDQFERFESTAKNMSSCVSQTYKTDIQRERRRKSNQMIHLSQIHRVQCQEDKSFKFVCLMS